MRHVTYHSLNPKLTNLTQKGQGVTVIVMLLSSMCMAIKIIINVTA